MIFGIGLALDALFHPLAELGNVMSISVLSWTVDWIIRRAQNVANFETQLKRLMILTCSLQTAEGTDWFGGLCLLVF